MPLLNEYTESIPKDKDLPHRGESTYTGPERDGHNAYAYG